MNEWDNEPDRKHWIDADTGLDCLIVRNGLGGKGALCGYVGVPKGHPWYGKDYSDCERADGDFVPGMDEISPHRLEEYQSGYSAYRNISYVENQCRSLAKQAQEMQST